LNSATLLILFSLLGYYGKVQHGQPMSRHQGKGGYYPSIQQQLGEAAANFANY